MNVSVLTQPSALLLSPTPLESALAAHDGTVASNVHTRWLSRAESTLTKMAGITPRDALQDSNVKAKLSRTRTLSKGEERVRTSRKGRAGITWLRGFRSETSSSIHGGSRESSRTRRTYRENSLRPLPYTLHDTADKGNSCR
jgi:hypothetical protein